jgi:restriction system protein
MPEELVILLAILIGAIWLLAKICQGIAAAIDQATKNHSQAVARRKVNRYLEGQNKLRPYIHTWIPEELDAIEKKFEVTLEKFELEQKITHWVARPPVWRREEFKTLTPPRKSSGYDDMSIDEIDMILSQNSDNSTWSAKESEISRRKCKYPSLPPSGKPDKFTVFPTFSADLKNAVFEIDVAHISDEDIGRYFSDEQTGVVTYNKRRAELISKISSLNSAIEAWNKQNQMFWEQYVTECKQMEEMEQNAFQRASELYTKACMGESSHFKRLLEGYKNGEKRSVVERLDYILDRVELPRSVPHIWEIDFDEQQRIALVEIGLPDVVHRPPSKTVMLKSGAVQKPLNQTERRGLVPKIHPAILLRIASEVFRNDTDEIIKLLVVNGWVKFDDPATGVNTKAYTASLMVERDQIVTLNLSKIDPLVAFDNLHGKSAGRLIEIIPIEPMLSLNRKDSRFVDAKEVLSGLGAETNLAGMDWQDFEHLIRELFEKEFSGRGAEVKITQASRDRGVDAIVFDPDPIHGGKYVIQAKRYTNTVDVSAVRDLCAVVKKEGASRGILVTTSTYGADAYAFANNEPVTLLNGAELLGLLKKHGYTFRINLQEARRSI